MQELVFFVTEAFLFKPGAQAIQLIQGYFCDSRNSHLLHNDTRSFLWLTSCTCYAAYVDRLAFVQSAVHFATLILYAALMFALEVTYFSMSPVEIRLFVCDAHL